MAPLYRKSDKQNLTHFVRDFPEGRKHYFISWPTLFFFEVACSLIVLDCTLRKNKQNIKVGGAKLQRTVPVYQCGWISDILHGNL